MEAIDDADFNQGGDSVSGGKLSKSRYILKVELMRLSNEFDIGYEMKEKQYTRMTPTFLT